MCEPLPAVAAAAVITSREAVCLSVKRVQKRSGHEFPARSPEEQTELSGSGQSGRGLLPYQHRTKNFLLVSACMSRGSSLHAYL